MAKIVRYNGNLVPFASSSLGTERTIFGQVTQANDITSQYTAEFLRGWGIVGPSDQPTLQDFNAVSYTHGQILSYLHQIGMPEYNAAQEYHIGSICNVAGTLYRSLTNTNVGNTPASSPAQWRELYPLATETVRGSVQIATAAQVAALTDDTAALTSKKFGDAFKGANSSSATLGFERMPSGIIRNWGNTTLAPVGNFNTQTSAGVTWYTQFYVVNLPQAYTTRHCSIMANLAGPTSGAQAAGALAFIKTNKTTAGPGESLTAFTVAITTPVLGLVPTIHFEGTGI